MIIDKTIEVKICGSNTKYYENLVYKVKRWEVITVPIEHLQKGSNVKVKVKCDICDEKKYLSYNRYNKNIKKYGFYSCPKCKDIKLKLTKKEKYGDENYNNMEQNRNTKLKNHGNENYNNRKQSKETCLEKYGVEIVSQSPEIIKKIENTKLENHGDSHYSNREKFKKTMEGKWKDRNKKRIETNLKKYGTDHPIQNIEIFDKIFKGSFKLKDYKLPSGKIVKVQGFENLALDILLKTYKEEDLLIEHKDIENRIGWIFYKDKQGIERKYYSDIYIISENKIIEVKSDWTYKNKKEINLLKQQACLNMGLNFEFMVFNNKKQLLIEQEVKNLV